MKMIDEPKCPEENKESESVTLKIPPSGIAGTVTAFQVHKRRR